MDSVFLIKNDEIPVTWTVEAYDLDTDGGVDVTIFSGADAEFRAREYAAWKYTAAINKKAYAYPYVSTSTY
jgi:hypothetical protein